MTRAAPQPQHRTGASRTAGDAAFSVAERVVSQLAQFAVFIVAARLLGPAEFGLFALASASASLLLRAAEAGWAPFIMSRSGDIAVPLQVLFIAILVGLCVGFAGGVAVLITGGPLGLSRDTVALLLTFALWVAVANAGSAQKGVLIWMGRIRTAAICDIAGELVALAVSIAALLSGAGIFALVYGRLASQTTALALSFAATRRAPRAGLPRPILKELWVFSAQIFSARMLIHARLHLVTLIIGGFLGPAAVGYFRAAERLVSAAFELIVVPGQLMAWTLLRRARDAGPAKGATRRINRQIASHLKVMILLGSPLLLWMVVMNDEILRGLLGDGWGPAAPLVAILALGRLFLFLGVLTEPLMSIVGQARRLPGFMALIFSVSAVLTVVAAPYGIVALAWSQVAVSALVMAATVRLFARYGGVDWPAVTRPLRATVVPLACGVGTITALNHALRHRGLPDLLEAAALGLIGAAVLAICLAALDVALRARIATMIRPGQIQKGTLP